MSHRSSSSVSRSAQAIWLCFAVALVADLASGSPMSYHHHLSKRFYVEECKGVYDQRIFAKLERICEDCYNVFREPSIHQLCKESCFDSDVFKGCLDTLMFSPDEIEEVKEMVKQVKGGTFPPDLDECFSTKFFKACVHSLMLDEEEELEKLEKMVEYVGKRSNFVYPVSYNSSL